MVARRSISWPVTLGVILIVLVVVLTVGWIIVNAMAAGEGQSPGVYYAALAVGTTFFVLVLVGVIMYLTLTIKAVRLTQRQSNFIDSVTHELKSPIASLKLYLQTLEKRRLTEEQTAEVQRSMLEVLTDLDHLIDHLLDAARLEKDVEPAPIENVDLVSVLESAAQAIAKRYELAESAITLRLREVRLPGHTKECEILFRNILDNAVKYSGTDPRVEIQIYAPVVGKVGVRISDSGPGIPANLRRKIFGRFVRLGNELERKTAGTGLGLYIVRETVRKMRGQVNVKGRGSEPGTIFEVELPGDVLIAR
ncbi:MAG: HAMP domain-containing sensor histidine kinase [Pirellulales bacterium]